MKADREQIPRRSGRLSILCFSLTGWATGQRLAKGLRACGYEVFLDGKSRYLQDSISQSTQEWTRMQFLQAEGIIFVGACGIAVRSIAPFVAGKKQDPAVLVADECGRFVISLLSGHLGGANELTQRAADILGAVPVITTATDLHHRFAVDVFAKKNRCAIFHMKAAKELSAALLAGEQAGFYSEYPWEGPLPEGLVLCKRDGYPVKNTKTEYGAEASKERGFGQDRPLHIGVAVTIHKNCMPFESTVQVVPPVVAVGMGCRKGKEKEAVKDMAEQLLAEEGLYKEAVLALASHELKKEEPGLLALSDEWNVPFCTFLPQELLGAPGEFTPSAFVEQVTGVDNVCERSAVCASGGGRLFVRKRGGGGVTIAAARKEWRAYFE